MIFGPLQMIKKNHKTGTSCLIMRVQMYTPARPHWPFTLPAFADGWGNGYVAIPLSNKYYRWNYERLNSEFSGRLPETLTFSRAQNRWLATAPGGTWIVGFDTLHAWNNADEHNRDWVIAATRRLEYLLNEDRAITRRRKLKKRNICKRR